ncbi:SigB/SigF/SigG family RNA polymerase sigma factor [Streptomonospora wellingtoniae]|uniref:SigB/SigF/SigG family RNA polymerase sigma factor n=1 Tax=Streptomonospora wellingtoniae TaxID=3075544 RepID=A0ABU2KTU6_9ACTN|nr:SigB/SigF/SigG family RNA polymerase sigma factor [Streptomonospora sp. DSM 45055]MDT0302548.1 SigB/SigF/SigG family RNA polymerase sigma factor [Streptomonospora sp. DSM 45055]
MSASSTLRERETAVPRPRSSRGNHRGNSKTDEAYYARTRELFAQLKGGSAGPAERDEIYRTLVDLHAPVVRRIARRYRNRGEPEEDLRQVVTVGLVQAIRDFKPEYGKEFISYALPMMTGEVKRHFRDRTWAIRVPRKYQEKRPELNRVTASFAQEHGRSPTVAEIAERLEMSVDDTLELIDASSAYSALSLDVPYGAEEEDKTLGDTLGAEDRDLESAADRASLRPALATLSPRDRRIVLLRFAGNKTQAEIAEIVGLSQMHVSRTLSASLAKLRKQLVPDV